MTDEKKPDYHLNNGHEPQKVDKDTQQFTGESSTPKEGDVVAAKGNDLEVDETLADFGDFSSFDWEMALKEFAIPTKKFSEIKEANAEQIAEAEKSLGDKAQAIFDSYGDTMALDKKRLASASEEQLEALIEAISNTHKIQSYDEQEEKLKKEIDGITQEAHYGLGGIWKGKYDVKPEEYPALKDSIQSKIDWLSENKPYGYSSKIEALGKFEEWYKKDKALKEELEKIQSDSPKGNQSQYEKTIAAFQDPLDLYSHNRKNGAVWCKTYEDSKKEFMPMALADRKKMTSAELDALIDYTSSYSTINFPLNATHYSSGYGSSGKKYAMQRVPLMTAALDKCKTTKDIWLQRGVGEMHLGGIDFSELMKDESKMQSLIGTEFINNGFMSCGSHKGSGFSGSLIMNIYCPKGAKMHYVGGDISHFAGGSEDETIIQRGYHFKITKIVKKNSQFFMDIDMLLGSDSDKLTMAQVEKMYDKYLNK